MSAQGPQDSRHKEREHYWVLPYWIPDTRIKIAVLPQPSLGLQDFLLTNMPLSLERRSSSGGSSRQRSQADPEPLNYSLHWDQGWCRHSQKWGPHRLINKKLGWTSGWSSYNMHWSFRLALHSVVYLWGPSEQQEVLLRRGEFACPMK